MFKQCYTYFWQSAVLFSLCRKLTIYELISIKTFYKNRKTIFRQWLKKTSCHLCIDWCTVYNLTKCPFWVFKLSKKNCVQKHIQKAHGTTYKYSSVSRTDALPLKSKCVHNFTWEKNKQTKTKIQSHLKNTHTITD